MKKENAFLYEQGKVELWKGRFEVITVEKSKTHRRTHTRWSRGEATIGSEIVPNRVTPRTLEIKPLTRRAARFTDTRVEEALVLIEPAGYIGDSGAHESSSFPTRCCNQGTRRHHEHHGHMIASPANLRW